jgi:hypothetical protein
MAGERDLAGFWENKQTGALGIKMRSGPGRAAICRTNFSVAVYAPGSGLGLFYC